MLRGLLITTVVILGLTACGDDDVAVDTDRNDPTEGQTDDAGTVEVTFAFDRPPSDDDVGATTAVIERRLEALGVDDAVVERTDDGDLSIRYPASAVPPERVSEVASASGDLTFRPVMQVLPVGAPSCTAMPAADSELVPQVDDDGALVNCFEVGPGGLDGTAVSGAAAELDGLGSWRVAVDLHPGVDGLDGFNELAAACFAREGTSCPTGQVAIVLDRMVMSAPSIQQPAFDETGVSIAGDFTEREARDLAVVLSSGALPVALTPQGIEAPR